MDFATSLLSETIQRESFPASGVVTEPAGAAFLGVKVKATQTDTGFSRIGRALLPGGAATWRELMMDRSVAAGDGRLALTATGETLRVLPHPEAKRRN